MKPIPVDVVFMRNGKDVTKIIRDVCQPAGYNEERKLILAKAVNDVLHNKKAAKMICLKYSLPDETLRRYKHRVAALLGPVPRTSRSYVPLSSPKTPKSPSSLRISLPSARKAVSERVVDSLKFQSVPRTFSSAGRLQKPNRSKRMYSPSPSPMRGTKENPINGKSLTLSTPPSSPTITDTKTGVTAIPFNVDTKPIDLKKLFKQEDHSQAPPSFFPPPPVLTALSSSSHTPLGQVTAKRSRAARAAQRSSNQINVKEEPAVEEVDMPVLVKEDVGLPTQSNRSIEYLDALITEILSFSSLSTIRREIISSSICRILLQDDGAQSFNELDEKERIEVSTFLKTLQPILEMKFNVEVV